MMLDNQANLNSSQKRGQLSLDVTSEEKAMRKAFLPTVNRSLFLWNMVRDSMQCGTGGEERSREGGPVRL